VIDNAIKYAPGSPIRITTTAPHEGIVQIAVADDGPGIPAEDREAIFERFYRGASRGEVEGSGLGLAIAPAARSGSIRRLRAARPSSWRCAPNARLRRLGRAMLAPCLHDHLAHPRVIAFLARHPLLESRHR
jgi:hypothetical protein